MKIKDIASICRQSKMIVLYEDVDQETGEIIDQWIGAQGTAYPVQNLPPLDEQGIYAIFGLDRKQATKWYFHRAGFPEHINFRDTDTMERPIESDYPTIIYNGIQYRPLQTTQGVVFVREMYISPFYGDEMFGLYERTAKTDVPYPYIVTKSGMLITGIVMPDEIITERLASKLMNLARATARVVGQTPA